MPEIDKPRLWELLLIIYKETKMVTSPAVLFNKVQNSPSGEFYLRGGIFISWNLIDKTLGFVAISITDYTLAKTITDHITRFGFYHW